LFVDLPDVADILPDAPRALDGTARRSWATNERKRLIGEAQAALGSRLAAGVSMDATFEGGELRFLIDGFPVVERVFADDQEGAFILAQWKVIASTFTITEKTTGKKLAEALRRVVPAAPEPLRSQVIALVETLTNTERDTATAEAEMNRRLYVLYGLTPEEITLVERG
jgi:hypothetical protein